MLSTGPPPKFVWSEKLAKEIEIKKVPRINTQISRPLQEISFSRINSARNGKSRQLLNFQEQTSSGFLSEQRLDSNRSLTRRSDKSYKSVTSSEAFREIMQTSYQLGMDPLNIHKNNPNLNKIQKSSRGERDETVTSVSYSFANGNEFKKGKMKSEKRQRIDTYITNQLERRRRGG